MNELIDFEPNSRPSSKVGIFPLISKTIMVALLCLMATTSFAQRDSLPLFTKLSFEVRADLDYHHEMNECTNGDLQHLNDAYGFHGRYFNVHLGGNLGKKFSYYFRQRVVANPGSSNFFDNTDFLYLNYHINDNWSIRVGKEALAVGGYEYDAPPVDVIFSTYYWDNFYCFQLAAGATYTTKDRKNTLQLQVGSSPYLHYQSPFGDNSLFSYNFLWNGNFGHFHTLYSFNMFQRDKTGHFMNYIALGNQLKYDNWAIYLDLIHHANSTRQLMKDFGVVCRADFYVNKNWDIFLKGSYEQNLDAEEWNNYTHTGEIWDCLALPGQQYFIGGIGFEFRPKSCEDVRIHGFVADYCTLNQWADQSVRSSNPELHNIHHDLTANVGVSWNMNFLKYLTQKTIK